MINEEFDFTDPVLLRKKAEEMLLAREKSAFELVKELDLKKLLHELQVHQIELEMQNQELARAYETAESALKKYTLIYDLAPMGLFILNAEAAICDLNFTGASLLGDKRISLLDSNFKLFVAKDSLPEFNHFLDQIFIGGTKMCCELNLGYDDKPLGQVFIEGVVTGDDGKCLLSLINLSHFKK